MKRSLAVTAVALALTTSLVACGTEKAAVCDSVDNLKASVADVKDIDVTSESGLSRAPCVPRPTDRRFPPGLAAFRVRSTPH